MFSLLSIIIIGSFVKFSYDIIMGENLNNKKTVFKQYVDLVLMFIILYLVIFLMFLSYLLFIIFFAFIPIIGIIFIVLGALFFICFIIYYLGYYRFVPYIALFDGRIRSFSKSKELIRGHLPLSIFVLILSQIPDLFLNYYIDRFEDFVAIIILNVVISIVAYSFILFEVSFVLTSYKKKRDKEKQEYEKSINQLSADNEDLINEV